MTVRHWPERSRSWDQFENSKGLWIKYFWGNGVTLHWEPHHVGLHNNKRADKLAGKRASMKLMRPITLWEAARITCKNILSERQDKEAQINFCWVIIIQVMRAFWQATVNLKNSCSESNTNIMKCRRRRRIRTLEWMPVWLRKLSLLTWHLCYDILLVKNANRQYTPHHLLYFF